MLCVNLRTKFGNRYRIGYDEARAAERGPSARGEDPWLMTIPCHFGHFFPHGGNLLAASVDGHEKVGQRLLRLGCVEPHQHGDGGEVTVLFDAKDFAAVAKVMRPRRKRQLTTEQKAALVSRLGRRETPSQNEFGDGRLVQTAAAE